MFDPARVRGLYPALSSEWVYLNSSRRAPIPEKVSSTSGRAFRRAATVSSHAQNNLAMSSDSNPVGILEGTEYLGAAREAMAQFINTDPACIFFGSSRQQLLSSLAFGLSRQIGLGREIVLSRIDDSENLLPWQAMAHHYGATVRWAEADLTTGTLPVAQYGDLVNSNTGIVSVSAAHSGMGTLVDVHSIAQQVRQSSPHAWLVVDATTYGAYNPIDASVWDADVVLMDLAPAGGPEVTVMAVKNVGQLKSLKYPFLKPSRHGSRHSLPARIVRTVEMGGAPPALLAAIPNWVNHWASLDEDAQGDLRQRLVSSMEAARAHSSELAERLRAELQGIGPAYVLGTDTDSETAPDIERLPRVSFMIPGVPASTIQQRLLSNDVVVDTVIEGESQLYDLMGVGESGGAVVAGISAFNTDEEIEQVLRTMGSLS